MAVTEDRLELELYDKARGRVSSRGFVTLRYFNGGIQTDERR